MFPIMIISVGQSCLSTTILYYFTLCLSHLIGLDVVPSNVIVSPHTQMMVSLFCFSSHLVCLINTCLCRLPHLVAHQRSIANQLHWKRKASFYILVGYLQQPISMFKTRTLQIYCFHIIDSLLFYFYAEKNWNLTLPGFGSDEIKIFRKPVHI